MCRCPSPRLARLPARPAAVVAVVLAFVLHSSVLAHAFFLDSSPPDGAVLPSAPTEVRVRFSEPVQPFGPGVAAISPTGQRLPIESVRVEGADLVAFLAMSEPGTYQLRWRVVTEDTHPVRGQLSFSVGAPSAPAGPHEAEIGGVTPVGLLVQTGARWLHFLGLALGFGTLTFGLLLHGREAAAQPRLRRLANVGVVLLVAAEPLGLIGQTASFDAAEAFDPAAVSAALDSWFGRAMGVRLGGAFTLWLLLSIVEAGSPGALALAPVVGWVLALFDGSSAHAASLQPTWLGLLVNAVHMSAAAVWTGGLLSLVVTRGVATGVPMRRVALASVGLLGLTGAAMALSHLPRLADVTASPYGLALAAKLLVVLAALFVALLGRRRAELAALAAVLLLAGLLVSLPPPA